MRVRPWPSRPFKLRDAGVVVLFLLAAALLSPSRQEGAQIPGSAEHSPQPRATLANNRPSHAEQARAIGAYGNLPLGFEANQGQTDSRVRFLSRGGGYSLFLTPNEAVLALQTGTDSEAGGESQWLETRNPKLETRGTGRAAHAVGWQQRRARHDGNGRVAGQEQLFYR